MSDQIADALNHILCKAQPHQHPACHRRAFLLLQLSRTAPVLLLRRLDADIVRVCSRFQNIEFLRRKLLALSDQLCIAVYLCKMLDPFRVSAVI